MRKRAKLFIAAAATLVALAVLFVFPPNQEPSYEGRSLTQWLTICTSTTATPGEVQQAEAAVRNIGTKAIPFLIAWIAAEPRHSENRIVQKLPKPVRKLLVALTHKRDEQYRYKMGVKGFQLLGENSAPAVPELTRLLNDTNSLYHRQNAAVALASIGTNGLPPLLGALANTNYPVRYALVAVVPLISNASPVVPILIHCAEDKDPTLAGLAVQALGRLQLEPDTIVPAITNALRHPDASVRLIAAQCFVTWLDAEAYRAAPSLQNLLNDPELGIDRIASNILAKIQARSSSTNAPP